MLGGTVIILVGALILLVVAHISLENKFWSIVRSKDRNLWEALGSPIGLRHWPGQSEKLRNKRLLFIREKKYLDLDEPELLRIQQRLRTTGITLLVGSLVLVVSGLCIFKAR